MAEDEKFVSRWARRKAESRTGAVAEDEVSEADTLEAPAEDAEAPESVEDPEDHPALGIDVETLDYESDFTVFMHEKVPEALRRRALRALWHSNPILANVDGLNDYDEDFTDSATVVEGLKAAYDEAVKRRSAQEAEAAKVKEGAPAPADSEPADGDETEDGEDLVAEAGEAPDEMVESDEDLEDGTDEA